MRTLLTTIAAGFVVLAAPALASPEVLNPQAGNVTSSSASICWELTEGARPGLAVFSDAAGLTEITNQVRIELQPLDNSRREVSSSFASRQNNRGIQSQMAAKGVGLARVSGLAPQTGYFLQPLALNSAGAVVASGPLVPVTTARSSVFVVESRQFIVDLAPLIPSTGEVSGALLIAAHDGSPYPLIAVVGDSFSSTVAYFDLSAFLDASGEVNLLPAVGSLELSLSWLGLPPLGGYFDPSAVTYTGSTRVAAATGSVFIGQGSLIHATAQSPYAVVGLPIYLDFSVTDLAGLAVADFNRPLLVESPLLAAGAGPSAALAGGELSGHPLIFSAPGLHTVTVRDSASSASTTVDVRVIQMNYQNWRGYHLGVTLAGGAPGDDWNADGTSNLIDYISNRDPRQSSGPVIGGETSGESALRIRFELNPFQTEYAVLIQVTPGLGDWFPSAKVPVIVEDHPDYNVAEVSWTKAELQAETGTASPGYFARLLVKPATDFGSWTGLYGLSGPDALPTANIDKDLDPNYVEFAFDSDPTSGASSGKFGLRTVPYGGGIAQIVTFPMRLGATPAHDDPAGGELVFDADGVRYRIQASSGLTEWTLDMVEVPVDASSLPALAPGYEYRSFLAPGGGLFGMSFTRVLVELLSP